MTPTVTEAPATPLLDNDLYGPAAAATYIPYAVAVIALGVGLLRSPTSRPASAPTAPADVVGAAS